MSILAQQFSVILTAEFSHVVGHALALAVVGADGGDDFSEGANHEMIPGGRPNITLRLCFCFLNYIHM